MNSLLLCLADFSFNFEPWMIAIVTPVAGMILAGVIIVSAGYSAAFLCLAAIAALGFALFLTLMPETRDSVPEETGGSTLPRAAAA